VLLAIKAHSKGRDVHHLLSDPEHRGCHDAQQSAD
jgi:hypothetical protein